MAFYHPRNVLKVLIDKYGPSNGKNGNSLDADDDGSIVVVGKREIDRPLGMTVTDANGKVLIARILAGSLIQKQGLLHPGDQIIEINGISIKKAEQVIEVIKKLSLNQSSSQQHNNHHRNNLHHHHMDNDNYDDDESLEFKIIPCSHIQSNASPSVYIRTLFNYDPSLDSLLPCRELGLPFVMGEIIEVLNREDSNYWQARKLNTITSSSHIADVDAADVDGGIGHGHGHHITTSLSRTSTTANNMITTTSVGLIPSQELEEMRRAFVSPEFDYSSKISVCGTKVTKQKKKEMYQLQHFTDFDKAELQLYEEVCMMPPFDRKTLVLIGAQGVGRRTLKQRLVDYDPNRFASPMPHTSRPIRDHEIDGKQYHFVRRDIMEQDIANNRYLECGELQGHLYGTKLDSIRNIIRSGKMCIIDCNPQCLKLLKTKEFMPYVVFIAAPSLEQLRYMHEWGRSHGLYGQTGGGTLSSRTYQTLDRALGMRNSRRGRTLQSLASFYEDEDLQHTIEESSRLYRTYETQFDLVIVNNNFDKSFELLRESVDALSTEPQWVPIQWVYSD